MHGAISVVVTSYGLGRTLAETLASVHAQSRAAAELIVVDDGSTDLLTRHALAQVERCGTRVVRAEHRGVSAARNLGARLSVGDYLVFLDADDLVEPPYFAEAAARLDDDRTLDFVTTAMRAFEGWTSVWTPPAPTWVDAIATGGVPHVSSMMRRRVWETVGGWDESIHVWEEQDFWATALETGGRGIVLETPLLRYRVRSGSLFDRGLRREAYLERLQGFCAKHRAAIDRHGAELLIAREAFLIGQREHHRALEASRATIATELAALDHEVAALRDQLGLGQAVDWGDIDAPGTGADAPVARSFVARFLERHRDDVTGAVVALAHESAAARLPSDTFDAVTLTSAMNATADVRALLAEACRIVKPGGVLLCAAAALGRESGREGWRFTTGSMRALLAELFPLDAFEVGSEGTVMACAAELHGVSPREIDPDELDRNDPAFPVVVTARAVKPIAPVAPPTGRGRPVDETTRTGECGAVLLYHRIGRLAPDPWELCVMPEDFRAQMTALLRQGHRPMPLEDFARAAAAGCLPPRAVSVTFDDGYVDALTVASPILVELGIPATFFVTALDDDTPEYLWDILEGLLLSDVGLPPAIELSIGGRTIRHATVAAQDRRHVWQWLSDATNPLGADERADAVRQLVAWTGRGRPVRDSHRRLTTAELRELAARPGHTIGAHTVHHLALPSQSRDVQRWEIVEGRARLERRLEQPVRTFAYPYGAFTAATAEIVRAAGFTAAVTCEAALVRPDADPVLLPRLTPTRARGARLPPRIEAWS